MYRILKFITRAALAFSILFVIGIAGSMDNGTCFFQARRLLFTLAIVCVTSGLFEIGYFYIENLNRSNSNARNITQKT